MGTARKKVTSGRNDCSQVPVWELSAHVRPYVETRKRIAEEMDTEWDLTRWTAPIKGLQPKQISRIILHEEPLIGLRLVDLVCHAMGRPDLLHTFTFVPGTYVDKYAQQMAFEEYMAIHDVQPPQDFLARRSQELKDLRERVLAEASVHLNR